MQIVFQMLWQDHQKKVLKMKVWFEWKMMEANFIHILSISSAWNIFSRRFNAMQARMCSLSTPLQNHSERNMRRKLIFYIAEVKVEKFYLIDIWINPLFGSVAFSILLWLTPDDLSRQWETSCQ